MKAVRIHEHGDLDVLRIEEIPDPECRPDQVLVEVSKRAILLTVDPPTEPKAPPRKTSEPLTAIASMVAPVGSPA